MPLPVDVSKSPSLSSCSSTNASAKEAAEGFMDKRVDEFEKVQEEVPSIEKVTEEVDSSAPSDFIFPSYDEFLKELDASAPVEESTEQVGNASTDLDDIFAAFENEITHLDSGKPTMVNSPTTVGLLGTADEQCIRLTAQIFKNPFQTFQLTPDASEEDIKRQFRKISLLIHPDKCSHLKAREAFQILSKAYETLQKPEMRKKYDSVIVKAKKRVLKEIAKENKKRRTLGLVLLPEEESQLQKEIMAMCDAILEEQEHHRNYAESCKAANERYTKEQEAQLISESINKRDEKRKWEETRDVRVNSWRNFKGLVEEKKVKIAAFCGLRHEKEQRTTNMPGNITKKPQHGIDESYKANWR
ncbi:DnaJ domain-containing protein [Cardiosporidium cionae]|uniref:DnaJ domain-containing protein n=1 Tax=Cardiosporidium cionae TaxID=476202 RepID=A0ABQ7J629_9APIC|nr:DnaJ domain-containing protein [Cardiosporidium cionae]|eukprot:KAF8819428.1 DnaJ domain-containing protein [Cardiosporidium cionae]